MMKNPPNITAQSIFGRVTLESTISLSLRSYDTTCGIVTIVLLLLYLPKKDDDNLYFVHGDLAFGIVDDTQKLNKTLLVYQFLYAYIRTEEVGIKDAVLIQKKCNLRQLLSVIPHERNPSYNSVDRRLRLSIELILTNISSMEQNGPTTGSGVCIEKPRRHASARHEVHARSWGFHSLLSAAFVGYFPLRWGTVPHSAFLKQPRHINMPYFLAIIHNSHVVYSTG